MSPLALAQLLGVAVQLMNAGVSAAEAYNRTRALGDKFVAENRDPSPAEWAEINAEIADKRAELHSG